jgi:hypothetical protein
MREYEMETTFDVPLRTFLRLVYGDDGLCLRQYHASCGKCEDATVPAWDVSEDRSTTLQGVLGSRTIAFSKPMELPSVIERLLGPSAGKRGDTTARPSRASLSFTEKQTLEVEPVNGNVLVRSAASLDSRWVGSERAEKFNAVVEIAYASAADPTAYSHAERTAMAARITVNAAGAWALQPVVERVMEHRAVSAFREWVVWIDEYVSERAARTGETRLPPLAVLGLGEEDVLENVRDRDAEDANTGESDDERQRGLHSLRRDASVTNKTRKKYPATPGTSRPRVSFRGRHGARRDAAARRVFALLFGEEAHERRCVRLRRKRFKRFRRRRRRRRRNFGRRRRLRRRGVVAERRVVPIGEVRGGRVGRAGRTGRPTLDEPSRLRITRWMTKPP